MQLREACIANRPANAPAYNEKSLALRRELGDRQGIAWSLHSLGHSAHLLGASTAARAMLEESLGLFRELADRKGVADSLGELTTLLLAQAEVRKAVRLWGAAHALRESIGAPLSPLGQAAQERQIAQARLALGAEPFAAAWEEGRGLTWQQAVSYALGEASVEPDPRESPPPGRRSLRGTAGPRAGRGPAPRARRTAR